MNMKTHEGESIEINHTLERIDDIVWFYSRPFVREWWQSNPNEFLEDEVTKRERYGNDEWLRFRVSGL